MPVVATVGRRWRCLPILDADTSLYLFCCYVLVLLLMLLLILFIYIYDIYVCVCLCAIRQMRRRVVLTAVLRTET